MSIFLIYLIYLSIPILIYPNLILILSYLILIYPNLIQSNPI